MVRKTIKVNINKRKGAAPKKQTSVSAIGKLLRAMGGAGGSALGAYLGGPVGLTGAAGTQLGALASKWLGFGDYRVQRNSVLTNSTQSIPAMHNSSQTVVVRHKEYIGPILSSIAFRQQYEIPLNPGLSGSFPWLAGVARRFQEYAIKGAVFHYIPASGTAVSGTSPSLGTVMIQTSYRASDTPPVSKSEMLNEYCASEAVPSEAFIHPIECDPRENPFNIHYVRSTAAPFGEPLMSYDLGKTFVATQGQLANGNALGDLWVTYEVELKKPVLHTSVSAGGSYFANFTAGTASNIFNGDPINASGSLAVEADTNSITIDSGAAPSFLIMVDYPASTFSAADWTLAATTANCTIDFINSNNDKGIATAIGSGAAQFMMSIKIAPVDRTKSCGITFTGVSFTGTPGGAYLSVFALDQ
jgi:hypothetical protein